MQMLRAFACAALLAVTVGSAAHAQDLACDPGDREVRALEFRGNRAFSDGELALRVSTTASSWARRHLRIFGTRRCLDSEELARDKYRVQLLYRYAGYYNTTVDTLVTAAGTDQVRVTFIIDEGEPIRITAFGIAGLDSVPNRAGVIDGLWTAVGKPYDQTRLAADIDTISNRLRNSGYPRPDVLREIETWTRDSLTAHVKLQVIPGPRVHIGDIAIDVTPLENHKEQEISDRVVRKLIGLGQGDLYREQSLVASQRNLYQTGAYRFVDIQPVDDSAKLYRDSTIALRATLIEDYRRDLNTEVGWASLDCFRTRAQVVDKDFLGGAQRLEVTGSLSKIGFGSPLANEFTRQNLCYHDLTNDPFSAALNYSLNFTLRQPTLLGTFATPAFSLYRERRSEYKAYLRTTYVGTEASLFKSISPSTSVRAAYSFELGRTEADPSLLCAAFSRCDSVSVAQITKALPLGVVSGNFARVKTDNILSPTRGYALRGESRASSNVFGSDPQLTFAKGVGEVAMYHPLGAGSVLALRLRAGAVIGGAVSPDGSRQPPQQERLYAGGASSVRGFQQNELGPLIYVLDSAVKVDIDDTTSYFTIPPGAPRRRVLPVGGNSLLVGNLDYRLRSPFLSELLQYTFFADVGSVWNRQVRDNFAGLKAYLTPGVGVRVFTPVGPVQVNAGYNPYPPVRGPALYTPPTAFKEQGLTGVYCAVAPDTPPPLNHLRDGVLVPSPTPCPSDFQPNPRATFLSRLTFTFSIGPDF